MAGSTYLQILVADSEEFHNRKVKYLSNKNATKVFRPKSYRRDRVMRQILLNNIRSAAMHLIASHTSDKEDLNEL